MPGMMVAAGKEMVDGGILPINIFEGTNKYSVDSYMRGKQMILVFNWEHLIKSPITCLHLPVYV